jgi:hypothetical protein
MRNTLPSVLDLHLAGPTVIGWGVPYLCAFALILLEDQHNVCDTDPHRRTRVTLITPD